MLSYVSIGLIGIGVVWLGYLIYINYFKTETSTTTTTTTTTTTVNQDLTDASAACVTLTNIAWKNKNAELAAKVAEVWTLMSKVPA
jgi:uncharacterized membrane protein YukC